MLENYPFIKIMLIIIALMVAVLVMTVIGNMIGNYRRRRKNIEDIADPLMSMARQKLQEYSAEQAKDAPEKTEQARVVAKRTYVWGQHAHTVYYATFELNDRSRTELTMEGSDYGMLAEGDEGTLTFRGKSFVRFDRR